MARQEFGVPSVPARRAERQAKPARKNPTPEPGTNASGAPPRAAIERELRVWDKKRPKYRPENFIGVQPDFGNSRQSIWAGDLAYGAVSTTKKSPEKTEA